MSSAFPCGIPSTTSNITMSPSSLSPARSAIVPPTCPAPTSAILLRAMRMPRPWGGADPGRVLTRIILARQGTDPAGNRRSAPTELLHGPSGVPDFRHMPDLVPIEIHDIDVVCTHALAGWRAGTALTSMGGGENAIGADAVSIIVRCKRLHDIASIGHEGEQPLHPVGVFPESSSVSQRLGLRREARIGSAIRLADLPALTRFASLKELLGNCCDVRHVSLLLTSS